MLSVFLDFNILQTYNDPMNQNMIEQISAPVRAFHLPKYEEIPNVGLYLEQTVKYINGFLAPFRSMELTASMVSNYVKKGLIPNPVKKQYNRDHIACLLFIAVAKNVLSMENLLLMFELQDKSYPLDTAYDYFRLELENVLEYVFGLKPELDSIGVDSTEEKSILRTAIIAVAHKLYLEQYLSVMQKER